MGKAIPTFQIENRTFSRYILGHNPFLGYSYLSRARAQEYQERFISCAPIRDVIIAAIEMGVTSMMLSTGHARCDIIAQAIEAAQATTGVTMTTLVIITPDFRNHLDFLRRVNCQVCLVHGQNTDSFFRRAEGTFSSEFVELLAAIRAEGFVPGMSTHNGGETIPAAETVDVAVINTPINKIAWRMCPCVEQVLGVIRHSSKKIIAMKPLAMGRIAPEEGMSYIANVAGVDGIVVGIGTPAEATETFGLAMSSAGA
ncbi:MAG: hypothetical protein ACUVX8_09055 [Candidatus Zipacnadales bacterium]